jgi:hypothetical protein
MADAIRAAFSSGNAAPICRTRSASWQIVRQEMVDFAVIEMLFIYQMARNPIRAVARRWWCRSLFRVSRGRRRCVECTNS